MFSLMKFTAGDHVCGCVCVYLIGFEKFFETLFNKSMMLSFSVYFYSLC